MHDALQPPERVRVREHEVPERAPVDRAAADRARKGRIDGRHGRPAGGHHAVHGGIGVEHGAPRLAQHGGGGALAHADGAGEADHAGNGAPAPHNTASTLSRSASSTSGSVPNQAAKPGRAW